MRFLLIGITIAAAVIVPTASSAATIMVDASADDTVGQSIVYQLREQISRSSRYKLAYTHDDAGFIINIVTLRENDGRTADYAAVLTMPQLNNKKGFDLYLNTLVGACGANVTEHCAANILAGFDPEMTQVVTAISEALKDNNKK